MRNEFEEFTIGEAAGLVRREKISPIEITKSALARIEQLNPRLNAFITVTAERALHEARAAEREILRGKWRGPLHGIPITLKDNIYTEGVRTTAGSRILQNFIPNADADVAAKLKSAGAILLGKTNLHEFAYGVTTGNPHYGAARNPWNLECIPGGSSGGSAAAVAAGLGFASVGTDTGGSIRIPSALCGIVGLKPNFGRVSCRGIVPLAVTLDHAGPITRCVEDAAIMLDALCISDKPRGSFLRALRSNQRKSSRKERLRIGWPREYFLARIDDEVRRAIEAAAKCLQKLGARIEDVPLPHLDEASEPITQIALAEALEYHESQGYFPARAAEYGADARKRLEMGGAVRAVDYLKAQQARERLRADFRAAFERVDAILAPSVPIPAPRIGEDSVMVGGESQSVRGALVRMNRPANSTGFPAISVPCGFTRSGLPIGLAIHGPEWGEANLLRIALRYEQATEWHKFRPSL
ncbi:MAG TPA: amidase [Candidatus Acidoferrales bacterium]|nr:amidase [Candidatus Acidoferrales bacterium]